MTSKTTNKQAMYIKLYLNNLMVILFSVNVLIILAVELCITFKIEEIEVIKWLL